MQLLTTQLPGVVVVEPSVFTDERGWFFESFNETRFAAALQALGLPAPRRFVQDNHSCSKEGVLRGLHYQVTPHAQGKLIRVVQGRAFDVAVDIRRSSASFGRWVGVELSATNHRQLWVPEGFAHGFLALQDNTQVVYKTTDIYAKTCERSLLWSDPALGIHWPALPGGAAPSLAEKDAHAPFLVAADL
jgi:dTDP-4-dehydrorhamnose 3,5-epimerase